MDSDVPEAGKGWKRIFATKYAKNVLTFLIFVAIAALFWFIMAINDNIQTGIDVRVRVTNVPDTATFINDPPEFIHVNLRTKGTRLLRYSGFNKPVLTINFREYASKGKLSYPAAAINASLKAIFGAQAQISAVSPDSISLRYSLMPGKSVPVELVTDLDPALGFVVDSNLLPSSKRVKIYSAGDEVDTVNRIRTKLIRKRNLKETCEVTVGFQPVKGVRIIPDHINVTIPVEPLVKSQAMVEIQAVNVPSGQSVLLFPSKVQVEFYTPLSRFNDPVSGLQVTADYSRVAGTAARFIPIEVSGTPSFVSNVELNADSVEFTVVK